MEAIALFNIEVIDISGSIEIHVGDRAPEPGTLSNNRVAGIIVDDLGYIGWRYQIHRRTERYDQSDRSTQALHFIRHENCSVGSECPMITIGPAAFFAVGPPHSRVLHSPDDHGRSQ